MRELSVENYFRKRVKETGGIERKVIFPGRRGAPDRLCGWPNGKHGMPEMKKPKGPGAEAHQKREHEKLRAIGIRVDVIHTYEQVDAYVAEMSK